MHPLLPRLQAAIDQPDIDTARALREDGHRNGGIRSLHLAAVMAGGAPLQSLNEDWGPRLKQRWQTPRLVILDPDLVDTEAAT